MSGDMIQEAKSLRDDGFFDQPQDERIWGRCRDELETYLGKSIDIIEREYWVNDVAERPLHDELYVENDSSRIAGYYSGTIRYLYELAFWEATFAKQDTFALIATFLKSRGVKKSLDFGGGIGGMCLYLAGRGIACDYLDIYGNTFKYAKWRFERSGVAIKTFNALEETPAGPYGAVTAFDVLEHVPDLEKTVNDISAMLEPGGFLLSKPSFAGGGLHLKRHEVYDDLKNFNDLLDRNGFTYAGRLKRCFFSEVAGVLTGHKVVLGSRLSMNRKKFGGNFVVHVKR